MFPFDENAELSDYPIGYSDLVYELNRNSAWKTVAIYVAKKLQFLGNPWLRQLEQAGNRSKSPGDILLVYLRRIELCKVGILCEIFRACDLFDALYIVYGTEPMDVDKNLYCSGKGKILTEVTLGETFYLTCKATGLPPPRYKWFHENVEIPHQTSNTLSLLITSPDQEGEYECRVTQYNRDEVIISEERLRSAPLTVKATNVDIIMQPVSVRVKLGEMLTLKCKAESHPIPNYQWYKKTDKRAEKLLRDQNSDTLRIENVKQKHKGVYYCIVSNTVSRVKSCESEVTVDSPPQKATVKLALIIANNKYHNYGPVPKAEDDAIALGRMLESMDFQVRYLRNLTLRVMKAEIIKFREMLEGDAYGLFYFGGHGFMMHDNYMMPIDAPAPAENKYNDNMSENELMFHIQQKKFAAITIIEDMCQSRPTQTEMPNLYKKIPKPKKYTHQTDFFFGYSTCPGSMSNDPINGNNGVYMSHLLKHISGNNPIEEVFMETSRSLRESVNSKMEDQRPMIKCSPNTPYRYLTDPVETTAGTQFAPGSTYDQFINFRARTGDFKFSTVYRINGTVIRGVVVPCKVTVQSLKMPFLNDIMILVSGLDDWEIEFHKPLEEQVELQSMNLGECHIFNSVQRVVPDETQGLVGIRIIKNRGTEDEISAMEELSYIQWIPQILRETWQGRMWRQKVGNLEEVKKNAGKAAVEIKGTKWKKK